MDLQSMNFRVRFFMKKLLLFIMIITHLKATTAEWHTVYTHGIVDNESQILRFTDAIATQKKSTVRFADASVIQDWSFNGCLSSIIRFFSGKNVNRTKMYMGQGPDIEQIHKSIQKLAPEQNIVLYGCSRGAAANINYLAKYNNPQVKALVLDAAPADIPATIKPTLHKFGINPNRYLTIFRIIFPNYPKNAIPPINAIKNIKNKQLPILLIHSKTDEKVLYENSLMLYKEFKKQGFENVHLIILKTGRHSFLLQNKKIKPMYLNAVHTFYKMYDLPYKTTWTQKDFDLSAHKPSELKIEKIIHDYHANLE